MGSNWTPEFEARVYQLFFDAMRTETRSAMSRCVKELEALGLTDRQIQNGLAAGALQLAVELGVHEGIARRVFSTMNREDVWIVLGSLQKGGSPCGLQLSGLRRSPFSSV